MKKLTCLLTALLTTASVSAAHADNNFSLGFEGFHDTYREPQPVDVTTDTNYGSVTGKWVHNWDRWFTAIDGRYSTGTDSYHSPSGHLSGARQNETDDRVRGGLSWRMGENSLSAYIGAGVRYFVDNGKGTFTDLGAFGYDRRITQFYAPIGITYSHPVSSGLSIVPNFEFDPLVYGNVNTRLANSTFYSLPGIGTFKSYNINNTQKSGYGVRGEIMASWQSTHNLTWQFGPFVRYWRIQDSNIAVDPNGVGWEEPKNTRLQYGASLRVLW